MSTFQQCALTSGLLTQADLDAALSALGGSRVMSSRTIADEELAAKLVDMGRLNRWQAEQLRQGRSKFNLGLYQIIDSIGQGGMGQVFKAEHTIMGRIVAVKVLPRSRSTPEAIVSFMHEIRAQGQLDHENLVRAYDAGHDGNVYFFVTEYVPGTDLRRLIRAQGKMSMDVAASVIAQAARGLDHAHSRGLIHRDVKPGNLLVTPDGRTKVSDLGLAGWFKEFEQTDAYGGKVVGTADYLAPEQILAPDKLSPAADVYSLGCTLYYAATCKVPFPGGNAKDKARAHCNLAPLDPRRLNPELSDDFVEVIGDMMAKRADQRIPNMSEVMARLQPWLGHGLPGTAVEARPPAPPPIRIPPELRNPASPLSDTEPFFLAQPAEDPSQVESVSQLSLGTQPIASASQETSQPSSAGLGRSTSNVSVFPPPLASRWDPERLLIVGLVAAVAALVGMIVGALWMRFLS